MDICSDLDVIVVDFIPTVPVFVENQANKLCYDCLYVSLRNVPDKTFFFFYVSEECWFLRVK